MRSTVVVLLTFIVTACGDNNGLLGTWQTQACESVGTLGTPTELWARGIYTFTESGSLLYDASLYDDSQCINAAQNNKQNNAGMALMNKLSGRSGNETITASFIDLGPAPLQEGLTGRRIEITLTSGDASVGMEGFYLITDGALCFSDMFVFEPTVFGLIESGSEAIDFENCLERHAV